MDKAVGCNYNYTAYIWNTQQRCLRGEIQLLQRHPKYVWWKSSTLLTAFAVSKIRHRLPNKIFETVFDSLLRELVLPRFARNLDKDRWSHISSTLQNASSFSYIRNTSQPKIRTIRSAQDLCLVAVDGTKNSKIHKRQIPTGLRQYDMYDTFGNLGIKRDITIPTS